jgi:hypothetical protein
MYDTLLTVLQFLNQLLTAGIAITAFSLLLYALTFNLRDRVARSFAIILSSVVIVFVGEAMSSATTNPEAMEFWMRFGWVGIVILPAAYLQFSDALLATTGKPSRGRRRLAVRLSYIVSLVFLITLWAGNLVGTINLSAQPIPHLEQTWLTWMFVVYYAMMMTWSWINFWRAYQRTVTPTSKRRMRYLLAGALAPALGSFPYLLFGSDFAAGHQILFWTTATLSNILVSVLLVLMAYAVAFFGVSWPDRVVKRRLFKWLMRGPVTVSTVLAITTFVRRLGEMYGIEYSAAVPIVMASSFLLLEYAITLAAPIWERWLFHGGDKANIRLIQTLEERLLTTGDLRQFLESILAAVCDRMQVSNAFVVSLGTNETVVYIGDDEPIGNRISEKLIEQVVINGSEDVIFSSEDYWLIPLHQEGEYDNSLLGFLGVERFDEHDLDDDQRDALSLLARRAALALEDMQQQQLVFSSLEALTPQIDVIQRLRAASRYDGTEILTTPDIPLESSKLSKWVKDALTHYWGGPKLTESPLLRLLVVQQTIEDHQDNPANALRSILRQGIDSVRPEGERRFTGEWILFNILEMKFMEGRKVREVALRLAMSEADLYRKQRVAIEAVSNAILDMENKARKESANSSNQTNSQVVVVGES